MAQPATNDLLQLAHQSRAALRQMEDRSRTIERLLAALPPQLTLASSVASWLFREPDLDRARWRWAAWLTEEAAAAGRLAPPPATLEGVRAALNEPSVRATLVPIVQCAVRAGLVRELETLVRQRESARAALERSDALYRRLTEETKRSS